MVARHLDVYTACHKGGGRSGIACMRGAGPGAKGAMTWVEGNDLGEGKQPGWGQWPGSLVGGG